MALSDWHEMPVRDTLKDLVTRVSLRVFVGPELCHDSEWLRISRLYQIQSMKALRYLRLFPKILRPVVGRFSSECRQLRHVLAQTRQLTDKVLQEREAARVRGVEVEHDDALTWAEEIAEDKGIRSDAAAWQLALSTVALHTSSDLIGQALLDLSEHPELLQPLRDEIHDVMTKDGRDAAHCNYSKADVQSLRLMDSVLKESQRLKPVSISKRLKRPSKYLLSFVGSNGLQSLWVAGSRRKSRFKMARSFPRTMPSPFHATGCGTPTSTRSPRYSTDIGSTKGR